MLANLSTRPGLRSCALAATAALTLLGGAGLPTVAANRADDDGDRPDLSRFTGQKVAWSACKGEGMPRDLQCAKLTVPLDYSRPGAGTLDLALARYRATGERRGSVVLNFGGPGGAGVPELAYGGKEFMDLTDGYDVVTLDPRGVGRSSPVSCGEGEKSGLAPLNDDTALADPPELLSRLKQAAADCAENSGPVLPHIGTVHAAQDLDVMRQALGDRKLNYLGFSYGSRLGAVYAARFPDKVGRMVLDGVDTLTEPLTEQGIAGARGQQVALDDFVGWCVKDIACPFGQDPRVARQEVVRLVHSLDEDPLPTDFGDDFTGQDLVGALGQGLYSRELWPLLERALAQLIENGDPSGVLGFTTGGFSRPLPFPVPVPVPVPPRAAGRADPSPGALVDAEDVPLDNLPAALMAINCADDPDRPTAARITADLERLRTAYDKASPVFGRYRLNEVLLCYGRPKGTDFIRDEVKDLRTPKILLVGTRGDPATPYRWTVETAKRLGSPAVVLDNKGEGHTGYGSSKCVHRKVDDFLLYGSLPPSGSSCGPDEDAG
ncbi:alpha/beta hydrolase [Streptomyces sp. ID05-04B]|uniref:alpha/beta hydrolase n=1 Tax=unclassified Streptomyces TaxID=2593676 RepID=UPI000D1A6056|nr:MULTISPECIES: alpha/beta hydrolase [unclassified Streptomyces]AVV48012.1 alpha/beta hydrolase [Streptomyces sp. P3]MDX5563833.1 alpha/beta hydrolase [Streptomyces sp. ID05-04B]